MKREDFKKVTPEHIEVCKKMVKDRVNACSNTSCEDCPFYIKNVTKGFYGCSPYGREYFKCSPCGKGYFKIPDNGVAALAEKFLAMAKGEELDNDISVNADDQSVLVVEYAPFLDDVCFRIKYQNTEILKRGEFYDDTLAIPVKSGGTPCFGNGEEKVLYIWGWNDKGDDQPFIVSREDAELINKAVRQLNEKYKTPQMWRAEAGNSYYCIDTKSMKVSFREDRRFPLDEILYKNKNYFRTMEEAEQWLDKIKEIFEEYNKQCVEQRGIDDEEK